MKRLRELREALEIGTDGIVDAYKKATPGEDVVDPADKGEYDQEGQMAKTQLRGILRDAGHMVEMFSDDQNLPEWVQNKITKAADYLQSAHSYMMNKDDVNESLDEVSRSMKPMKSKFGTAVDAKKFDVYKKFVKQNNVDEPTVRMIIDNPNDAESKRMMKNKDIAKAVDLRKAAMKEEVELDEAKFTDKQIKMAYGILNDPRWKGGNMTAIVKKLEQIAKGLSKHPGVQKALQATNEDLEEKYRKPTQAEIDADKKKDRKGKPRPSMSAKSAKKSIYKNMMGGLKEKLTVADGMAQWIKDFQASDAPQFKGKDKEERKEMAIAAYLAAKREEKNESTKAYGKSMQKQMDDKKKANISSKDKETLGKLAAMMAKEKGKKK